MLVTDYLVIGAGAASMAFVDTLLTEQPNATVTIVDQHDTPGGHWNDAYGHVRLHQPSLVYGVSSKQLEGSWWTLLLRKWTLPWMHRASKTELLTYYRSLMDKWVQVGRVDYYPGCTYDFSQKPDWEEQKSQEERNDHETKSANVHTFSSNSGDQTFRIHVNVKLVNGIVGECKVPSKCAPKFTVGEGINIVTPNQIYDMAQVTSNQKRTAATKYVVLGNGKTAMDAVVFLQRSMNVSPDNIHWVIPNDVWLINRAGPALPSTWPEKLLEHNLDKDQAALALEAQGAFFRLDKKVLPTKFRYALVSPTELTYMQRVSRTIRRGRVTSITTLSGDRKEALAEFTGGESLALPADTVFVHCTSGGPFNANDSDKLFTNEHEMSLWLLFAPPVPICMSLLAALESRRRNGVLDVEFGRRLVAARIGQSADQLSADQVLHELVRSIRLTDDASTNLKGQVDTLATTSIITCLLDRDPKVAYQWIRSNRLSTLSIPMSKGRHYESIVDMIDRRKQLGLDKSEVDVLELVAKKLEPLKGM